jgi:excisionase family DNA binding protein
MFNKINFDLMEIAMKMPNAILQITAGDLCEFANQLINSATEVARLQIQRADISKELLTIDEVAEMLKVSKMTLHRWDKNGVLKKIEVGGHRRYRRSDVEAVTLNRKDA